MSKTQEIQEIEDFIKEYNKRVAWNRELRKGIDPKSFAANRYKYDIDSFLPVEELKLEDIDIETAVFESGVDDDGYEVTEIEVWNHDDCGVRYYRYKNGQDEQTYKERKIAVIMEFLTRERDELNAKLEKLNLEIHDVSEAMLEIHDVSEAMLFL